MSAAFILHTFYDAVLPVRLSAESYRVHDVASHSLVDTFPDPFPLKEQAMSEGILPDCNTQLAAPKGGRARFPGQAVAHDLSGHLWPGEDRTMVVQLVRDAKLGDRAPEGLSKAHNRPGPVPVSSVHV